MLSSLPAPGRWISAYGMEVTGRLTMCSSIFLDEVRDPAPAMTPVTQVVNTA